MNHFQPLPEDKAVEKSNPTREVSKKVFLFWKVFAILCFLAFVTLLLMAYSGRLDGLISNEVEVNSDPQIDISNAYDFNSTTNNQFDQRFVLNAQISDAFKEEIKDLIEDNLNCS